MAVVRRWFRQAVYGAILAAGSSAYAAEPVVIEIREYRFNPATVTVKTGEQVKWVNAEKRASHSVWFQEDGRDESERLLPGESWQRAFDRPGTFRYTCGPHPEMSGTVIVVE